MAYRRAGSLEAAVRALLTAKPPMAGDKAIAELALLLAKALDSGHPRCPECNTPVQTPDGDPKVAAQLLAALEALEMSPRSRARAHRGEVKDVAPANPLDQLAARRAGKRRPPALDTGPP